jgi:hypothetical protein
MILYELKIKITAQEKKKFIDILKLSFVNDYADIDHFLAIGAGQPKEKIEEISGRIIHSVIEFNKTTGLFQVTNNDITDEPIKVSDYKTQDGLTEIQRTKEVYDWPGMSVNVAFDYLRELDNVIFFRVYGKSEAEVFKAKAHLVELGYRKFVTKTYIDLFSVQQPIYKEPLAWIILIAIIALGVFLLWYFQ